MEIHIETQDVEIPPHSNKHLKGLVRGTMEKAGLQIAQLHLSLRDVNGKKGGRDKLCTVRATLIPGGEIVVVDRSNTMREGLLRALRRSRSVIRRELIRRRQRARKVAFTARTGKLETPLFPA